MGKHELQKQIIHNTNGNAQVFLFLLFHLLYEKNNSRSIESKDFLFVIFVEKEKMKLLCVFLRCDAAFYFPKTRKTVFICFFCPYSSSSIVFPVVFFIFRPFSLMIFICFILRLNNSE